MPKRDGQVQVGHHWPIELHDRVVREVGPQRVAAFTREAVSDALDRMDPAFIGRVMSAVTGGAPRKPGETPRKRGPSGPRGSDCPVHRRPMHKSGCPAPGCDWTGGDALAATPVAAEPAEPADSVALADEDGAGVVEVEPLPKRGDATYKAAKAS